MVIEEEMIDVPGWGMFPKETPPTLAQLADAAEYQPGYWQRHLFNNDGSIKDDVATS